MASRVIIVEKRALNAHSIQPVEDESFAMESHQAPLRHALLSSFLFSFFFFNFFPSSPLSLSLCLFPFTAGRLTGWSVRSYATPSSPFRRAKRSRFRLSLVSIRRSGIGSIYIVGRHFATFDVPVVSFLPNLRPPDRKGFVCFFMQYRLSFSPLFSFFFN